MPAHGGLAEPFASALRLYDQGRYLDAYRACAQAGPVEGWPLVEPLVLGGRIATQLGGTRLGRLLHLRAFRAHPEHPDAQLSFVYNILERYGAFEGWLERERLGAPSPADAHRRADYHMQCARIMGELRDFDAAESHLELARSTGTHDPYWYVVRAGLFMQEDRYQDALAVAREGMTDGAPISGIVSMLAHALLLVDRRDEALDVLREHSSAPQGAVAPMMLLHLLAEDRRAAEAEELAARIEAFVPFRDRETEGLLATTRARLAIGRGDYAGASRHVHDLHDRWHAKIGARLRAWLDAPHDGEPRRVELAVPFVRQHHDTCAPATLSALGRFWGEPTEHLALAEKLTYEGTLLHSARQWALDEGWIVREFRVDWASAVGLIDRGVPFTLATVDIVNGHLQAVIGYDEPTGILLVRDPTFPVVLEADADALVRAMAARGPRGMAIVPANRAALLDGLTLPDAELYDVEHEMVMALERHDRDEAARRRETLRAMAPGHRITLDADAAFAAYDVNPHEMLAAVDALRRLFPADQRLLRMRQGTMQQVESREKRLAWLTAACDDPAADPVLWADLAQELMADARRLPEAVTLLRRASRRRRAEPSIIRRLADAFWRQGRREEALERYRIAATLADKDEGMALAYMSACAAMGRAQLGLDFLRARVARYGMKSGGPSVTLAQALDARGLKSEALAELERATERRPKDGWLRLEASQAFAAQGRTADAARHRKAASGHVKRTQRLHLEAVEAREGGDHARALALWQAVLDVTPLDMEAHEGIVTLLVAMERRADAMAHLRAACDRFPHHVPLLRLWYQSTNAEPAPDREAVLRRVIAADPAAAVHWRELARLHWLQGRSAEALDAADASLALAPESAAGLTLKALLLWHAGRPAEAVELLRDAIRRSADHGQAIHLLLETNGYTVDERREVLDFVLAEIDRQPIMGDGLLAYRAAARGVLTPDELLERLRGAQALRPELWQSWSALVTHLLEMGRTDDALATAREAVERFPMFARAWLDLSRVHRARREPKEQIEVLRRARELSPVWATAIFDMAGALEAVGQGAEAVALLEGAVRQNPLDVRPRHRLATLQRALGDRAAAIETIRTVLRLLPSDTDGWRMFAAWSAEAGDADGAIRLAREFAESRPSENRYRLVLARLLLDAERVEDALAATERAIAIDPRNVDAHDLRAAALAQLERFDEARAACHPAGLDDPLPANLRGREAWVMERAGDTTGAIERMRALVAENPGYFWGWSALCSWHRSREEWPRALEAAERMHWLEPSLVQAFGMIAEFKYRMADVQEALEWLERAVALEPGSLQTTIQCFRVQLDLQDLDGAQRTLAIATPYLSTTDVLKLDMELAFAKRDEEWSGALLAELFARPDADQGEVTRLARQMISWGWTDTVEGAAAVAIEVERWGAMMKRGEPARIGEPGRPAAAVTLWGECRAAQGDLCNEMQYRFLAALGARGRDAILALLKGLGAAAVSRKMEKSVARDHLRQIRESCAGWETGDDMYWGQVGYALVCLGDHEEADRWSGDWRSRAGAAAWMVQNIAVAKLALGDESAWDVLREVGADAGRMSQASPLMKSYCAAALLLAGRLDDAEPLLAPLPESGVLDTDRAMFDVTRATLDTLRAPGGADAIADGRRLDIERALGKVSGFARRQVAVALATKILAHTGVQFMIPQPAALPKPLSRFRRFLRWWTIAVLTYQCATSDLFRSPALAAPACDGRARPSWKKPDPNCLFRPPWVVSISTAMRM